MSETVGWILLPTLFAFFVYSTTVLCVWPYARRRVPFFPLLFLVFLPPLFPGLLFYLLVIWLVTVPVPDAPTIVVVDRGRPRVTTRPAGNRV